MVAECETSMRPGAPVCRITPENAKAIGYVPQGWAGFSPASFTSGSPSRCGAPPIVQPRVSTNCFCRTEKSQSRRPSPPDPNRHSVTA
jgi:hypothetical protein